MNDPRIACRLCADAPFDFVGAPAECRSPDASPDGEVRPAAAAAFVLAASGTPPTQKQGARGL